MIALNRVCPRIKFENYNFCDRVAPLPPPGASHAIRGPLHRPCRSCVVLNPAPTARTPDAELFGPCSPAHSRGSVEVPCLSAHSPRPSRLARAAPPAPSLASSPPPRSRQCGRRGADIPPSSPPAAGEQDRRFAPPLPGGHGRAQPLRPRGAPAARVRAKLGPGPGFEFGFPQGLKGSS